MASLSLSGVASYGVKTWSGTLDADEFRIKDKATLARTFAPARIREARTPSLLKSRAFEKSVLVQRRPVFVCALSSSDTSATKSDSTVFSQDGPERPTPGELARTLFEMSTEATLSTISATDGFPFGTHIFFSIDAEGRPVLQIPADSIAAVNLANDQRCSLHVQVELPGKQKPHCTLQGRVFTPSDSISSLSLQTAWKRRFGESAPVTDEEFSIYWMEIDRALVAADVDEEGTWISGVDFQTAEPDPLRDSAADIVTDVNREHWEDIRRFCSAYAKLDIEVEDASLTWMDKFGFDLRVLPRYDQQLREVRVKFPRQVTDERDARSVFTMMAQVAWESEKNYFSPL